MAASVDPSLKFSTIETGHFAIHYHQGLEETGKKAAGMAEDIHASLSKDLLWSPREKTNIVLIDNTDFANASATVLPYNTIYVQVVPPMADMTIGEYEDWLRLAITHEYAHIITMDTANGYSEITRKIFGKPVPGYDALSFLVFIAAAPPNVLLPSWWLEGMSTWAETEYNNIGRGRSSFYEMILRMAVAEDNIPAVDKLNGEVPYWPDGHMPYIYGLRLKMYIAKKYGNDVLGRLNIAHARRFPYFINGVPDRFFSKDYASLYKEMTADLKKEQSEKLEALKKTPLTPFRILPIKGEILTNPRYSPDNTLLAFNRADPHEHEAIVITDKNGQYQGEFIRRLPSDHNITWSPDSKMIYFTQAEIYNGFNLYQDIYCYDIRNKKQKQLTRGLRAKDPDLSPDGKILAFIRTDRGSQNLALINSDGDERSIKVITDYKNARLSNPRWSSDGKLIVFSVKDDKGHSSLQLYDILNKTTKVLLEDGFNNIYPVWSPDNKFILFTSDRTGVYNLFAYSFPEGKIHQATHLIGGAFQPDISRDSKDIIFSSYNSRGFNISTTAYNPETWEKTFSPGIKPYWQASKTNTSEKTKTVHTTAPKAYSALTTLAPRFWLPTLSADHKGPVAGIFTASQDVLGYNSYIINAGYGVDSGHSYFDMSYYYDYLPPTFFLKAYSQPALYSDFFGKGDYYERQNGLVIGMSVIPLNYVESRYKFTVGYHLKKYEHLTELTNGMFEGTQVFEGRRDNLFLGLEFSNVLRYPYSISNEEGRNISLYYRNYSKSLGSDINSSEYIGSYQEYINLSFLGKSQRHSVAYLKLKGAVSDGELISQQAFQLGGYQSDGTEFPLRGYPSRFLTGEYIATATLEYRSPVKYLFRGWNTKPFFWDRLHSAVFVDSGIVWDKKKDFAWRDVKTGVGGELRLDMVLGYKLYITPAIGIAHGLDSGGETRVYFTIYVSL